MNTPGPGSARAGFESNERAFARAQVVAENLLWRRWRDVELGRPQRDLRRFYKRLKRSGQQIVLARLIRTYALSVEQFSLILVVLLNRLVETPTRMNAQELMYAAAGFSPQTIKRTWEWARRSSLIRAVAYRGSALLLPTDELLAFVSGGAPLSADDAEAFRARIAALPTHPDMPGNRLRSGTK